MVNLHAKVQNLVPVAPKSTDDPFDPLISKVPANFQSFLGRFLPTEL